MYVAVGLESGEVYASGKWKCDCLRELNKLYPYKRNEGGKHILDRDVLPEAIILKKVAN